MSHLNFLQSSVLPVHHAFFTRQRGVSTGLYESLNFSLRKDDLLQNVKQNRALVSGWFGVCAEHLLIPHQVHKDRVLVIDEPFQKSPEADGLITQKPDLVIGITAADC